LAQEVFEQNRYAPGECNITGETLVLNTDIVALQPLLLVQVFMPPAALYATVAATTAASHQFHANSCLFFHFALVCFESSVREVMQASLIPAERSLTCSLGIQPRRHTTAVPKAAKVFQASLQALHPSSYHVQDGIIFGHALPIEVLSTFEG